jgi:hypothetical protein
MTSAEILRAKSLIFTLAHLRTFQGAEIAEEILERLIAEGSDGRNVQVQIETKLYNTIIDAYGKCREYHGVDRAEALVERMNERSKVFRDIGGNEMLVAKSDLYSYNNLLNAWSRSEREDAVVKAEKIVAFLESSNSPMKPNSVTYNIMMNTYANQVGEYGYAQKAEDVLLRMTSLQKDGDETVHPDTKSFNTVLKAWKNSGGGVESAKRAEDILRLMVKLYTDGHYDLKPDSVSFKTVIHAYNKHGNYGRHPSDIVSRVLGIGDLLLDDSTDLCRNEQMVSEVMNEIFKFVAKSGVVDASEKAKRLFDKMHDSGDIKDNLTYDRNNVHNGHELQQSIVEGRSSVRPTTQLLNSLLHIYCKERNIASAQDLFQTMKQLAQERGYKTTPDVITYNMMADLYFQTSDEKSVQWAMSLLDQMEGDYKVGTLLKLGDFVYTVVINLLSKSKVPELQGRAYDVMMRMIDHFDDGKLDREPEAIVYNMVLSSFMNQPVNNKADKALVSDSVTLSKQINF